MGHKFTKGKWFVSKEPFTTLIATTNENGRILGIASVNENSCQEYNAKLLANAPELLLALEMAVMVMPNGHTRNQCLEVIKKATE